LKLYVVIHLDRSKHYMVVSVLILRCYINYIWVFHHQQESFLTLNSNS